MAVQHLTGYGSKNIIILYVGRSLASQGLIQAYYCTNRIYGREKEFGSIVNFQDPKITESMVNEVPILFGSGGESSQAIVMPHQEVVEAYSKINPYKILYIDDLINSIYFETIENPKKITNLSTILHYPMHCQALLQN